MRFRLRGPNRAARGEQLFQSASERRGARGAPMLEFGEDSLVCRPAVRDVLNQLFQFFDA
jgi:hypothetical protein